MDDAGIKPARHRLTVPRYEDMIRAGIFGKDDRIELIDGELIDMAPIGQERAAVVAGMAEGLFIASAGRATVWPQSPVLLDASSLPKPDLALLRRRGDYYARQRPAPADILLLIEVSDTSLHFDRTVKLPRYARAGIVEVWIVDLKRRVLDVFRRPEGDGYAEMSTHHAGAHLALAAAPDIVVTIGPIFG